MPEILPRSQYPTIDPSDWHWAPGGKHGRRMSWKPEEGSAPSRRGLGLLLQEDAPPEEMKRRSLLHRLSQLQEAGKVRIEADGGIADNGDRGVNITTEDARELSDIMTGLGRLREQEGR